MGLNGCCQFKFWLSLFLFFILTKVERLWDKAVVYRFYPAECLPRCFPPLCDASTIDVRLFVTRRIAIAIITIINITAIIVIIAVSDETLSTRELYMGLHLFHLRFSYTDSLLSSA